MKYTKPEIFTEQFDVEDVITASSPNPGPGPDPEPPVYDPSLQNFEGGFLPFN